MNTRLADAVAFSIAYGPSLSQGYRLSETDKRRLYEQNSRLSERSRSCCTATRSPTGISP